MKPATQFKMYSDGRREETARRNESKQYIVRRLNKDGSFSKAIPFFLDCCDTLEAAQVRKTELERMNPSSRYGIDG